MPLSIIPVSQVFGRYDQQIRMADLNKKNPVKTIQNQVDRVTISPEATKKRAIDAAVAAIQIVNQESNETRPATEKNSNPDSYVDSLVSNALKKSHELREKEQGDLVKQSESVRDMFLNKSHEIDEEHDKEIVAKKKEKEDQEATPF